jgi:hypothetical protein
MAELRILRQKFQQFDRCMVCPLQVIQEQDQWMVLPGKYSNEFPENSKKPVFGFLRTISFRLSLTSMVFPMPGSPLIRMVSALPSQTRRKASLSIFVSFFLP